MSENNRHTLVVEDLNPTKIQSEIPEGPCRLRNPENNEKMVSEVVIKNVAYSEIDEVPVPVPVRRVNNGVRLDDNDDDKVDKKSRIPVSRFTHSVDRNKNDGEIEAAPSKSLLPQPRMRTNIPVSKTDPSLNPDNKKDNRKTVEDFDRLFDDLNEKGERITSFNSDILKELSPADPEQVDNYFEQIINSYQDEKANKTIIKDTVKIDDSMNTNYNDCNTIKIAYQNNVNTVEISAIDTPTVLKNFDDVLNVFDHTKRVNIVDELDDKVKVEETVNIATLTFDDKQANVEIEAIDLKPEIVEFETIVGQPEEIVTSFPELITSTPEIVEPEINNNERVQVVDIFEPITKDTVIITELPQESVNIVNNEEQFITSDNNNIEIEPIAPIIETITPEPLIVCDKGRYIYSTQIEENINKTPEIVEFNSNIEHISIANDDTVIVVDINNVEQTNVSNNDKVYVINECNQLKPENVRNMEHINVFDKDLLGNQLKPEIVTITPEIINNESTQDIVNIIDSIKVERSEELKIEDKAIEQNITEATLDELQPIKVEQVQIAKVYFDNDEVSLNEKNLVKDEFNDVYELNKVSKIIAIFENTEKEVRSRIPRRFNRNIKVYPTKDDNKIEATGIEPATPTVVIDDALKIQSIFRSMKSMDETESTGAGKPEIIGAIKKNDEKYKMADENRVRRFKSMPSIDNNHLPRTKSKAELDLGNSIKGRVESMVKRISAIENNKHKEYVKLPPKKLAVLNRVAMFEQKKTHVKMEEVKVGQTEAPALKERTEDELKLQIEELTNAKKTYGTIATMPTLELSNGVNMPVLAVGTALLDPELATHIIKAAIDLGYRAIDTAYIYGTEKLVGDAIREKIEDGTVKREDLFIMNKLWSTYHRPDLVEQACRASLTTMGLDYFDLYLIHNPMSFREGKDVIPKIANVLQYSTSDYLDAWHSMEDLVKIGLAHSIGVSNFNSQQINRIVEKGTRKPVINQVESHPYLNQQRLSDFCAIRDIKLSCFSVLGSKGTPAEYKSSETAVIDDPIIKVLAAAASKTPAQILIRYQLDQDRNVVVKTSSAARLWENLQSLNLKLTSEETDALNALNKNKRYHTFKGMGDTHRNYPFTIPY